jgi:hypothetical protein
MLRSVAKCGGIVLIPAAGMLLAGSLTGCIVVGVSNRGGWFIWPRGFGLLFVFAILLILLLRRRR